MMIDFFFSHFFPIVGMGAFIAIFLSLLFCGVFALARHLYPAGRVCMIVRILLAVISGSLAVYFAVAAKRNLDASVDAPSRQNKRGELWEAWKKHRPHECELFDEIDARYYDGACPICGEEAKYGVGAKVGVSEYGPSPDKLKACEEHKEWVEMKVGDSSDAMLARHFQREYSGSVVGVGSMDPEAVLRILQNSRFWGVFRDPSPWGSDASWGENISNDTKEGLEDDAEGCLWGFAAFAIVTILPIVCFREGFIAWLDKPPRTS